jgi:hypothetical protein
MAAAQVVSLGPGGAALDTVQLAWVEHAMHVEIMGNFQHHRSTLKP